MSIISIHNKKKQSTDKYYQAMLAKDAINYNESMGFNDIKIEESTVDNNGMDANDALPNIQTSQRKCPSMTGSTTITPTFMPSMARTMAPISTVTQNREGMSRLRVQ